MKRGLGGRSLRLFAIAMSVLTMLLIATGPTSAAQLGNNTAPPTGTDSLQGIVMKKMLDTGKRVDLSKDWGEVTACTVAHTTSTRCYATEAEMDAAETQFAEEVGGNSPALACGGWLGRNRWVKLYEHINFNQGQSGRVLQFNDANYWQVTGQVAV